MKKLAIVGTAPSSVNLAPYNNPDYEIWGLNGVYSMVDYANINNFTRWFETHLMKDIKALSNDTKYTYGMDYMAWLQNSAIPVYMVDKFKEIPMSVKYPLDEILEMFPERYFNNTVSYMLALAIYEGYEDINIYGVDMATSGEYGSQRPSCEFFIGYAKGRGIKVYIPDESDLLKTPYLYGFEDEKRDAMRVKLLARKREMEQKKAEFTRQAEIANASIHTYNGVIQDVDYLLGAWL